MPRPLPSSLPRFRRLAAALVGVVVLGAAAPSSAPAQVIGKAGAAEIGEPELRRLVAALPAETRAAVVAERGALEQLVRAELARRLMLADLRAQGFERDPAAVAELERLREDALIRAWLERNSRVPDGYPDEAEVKRAYEEALARRGTVADYRLAQIFVALPDGAPPARAGEALRKVADLQARLVGGDFAQLARQYSEHAESAAKGGELGFVAGANLLGEVRAALAEATPGTVVGPVKTAQGFHFVRLAERRPAPPPALAEVREALVTALRQQRATEAQREYLDRLGAATAISVNQVELDRVRAGLK